MKKLHQLGLKSSANLAPGSANLAPVSGAKLAHIDTTYRYYLDTFRENAYGRTEKNRTF